MSETPGPRRKGTLLTILPIVVVLFPLAYSMVSWVFAQGATPPQGFLDRPDAKYEQCIKETVYMRFHHWELLRGVREEVVRYGRRGEIGLYRCRECHTSRARFCDQCHDAVSLTPDCFDCHYYP